MAAEPLDATSPSETISAHRLLPVTAVDIAATAVQLAGTLADAGIPLLEITLRTQAGIEAIEAVAAERPNMLVGAGTVLCADDAMRAIAAGARFVVSPGLDEEIVSTCKRSGVLAIPGVCTPTEIQHARRLGLSMLKFFPAEPMGGAATLRALSGPFATVRFIPTGGVTNTTARAYLALPCVAACGSSWLADATLVRSELNEIKRRAGAMLKLVDAAR